MAPGTFCGNRVLANIIKMRSSGCFLVGAIVNSAAMNTGVHVSFRLWFSPGLKKNDEVVREGFHSKWGFPGGSEAKNPPAKAGDRSHKLIP